jgi:hypothetical protein
VSLYAAQRFLRGGPVDGALDLAAAAAWLVIGWRARRPALPGAVTAALVGVAAILARGSPPAVLLFAPIWAGLFWLPSLMREGAVGARLARALGLALGRAFESLACVLLEASRRLSKYPRSTEAARIALAGLAGLAAFRPFIHNGIMGGVDAQWYTAIVADHLQQWRQGLGPVFVGQTRFAPIGTVMPLRVAPLLQHLTLAIDVATLRSLAPYTVLNLAIVLSGTVGCLSAYLCLKSVLPRRRLEALFLAVIYIWCPAVVGLAYTGQLFMSVMTLPFLPLVFAGLARLFTEDRFTGWAMVAAGCSGCWLAHSPIGLWVCVSATVVIGARWALAPGRIPRELWRVAGAAALFLAACGYVFVSIKVLSPPPAPPIVAGMLPPILSTLFPAVLEPVSATAGMTSDLQPGWSILLCIVAAAAAGWIARSRALLALGLAAVLLLCLSLPIPLVNDWLWHRVPQAALNITNAVPTQRLFPILAACSVTLAAGALSVSALRRRWALAVLAAAVLWSACELRPFIHRGSMISNSTVTSEQLLSENNLITTIFSTGLLPGVSGFYSYGFMDYGLEQRVLGRDRKHYIVSDVATVAPGFDFGHHDASPILPDVFKGEASSDGRRWINIKPNLTLAPRQHYLLEFNFTGPSYRGVLQIQGNGLNHEYFLPDSGERFAFGSGSEDTRVLPLFNPSDAPLELTLDFVVQDPDADLGQFASFAQYRLQPYEPDALPIRLKSYAPYVTEVRSPEPGYFESFRYFIPGWTATVNGRSAEISQSKNGMVTVPIAAGDSEIRLTYVAPMALSGAYLLMIATWVGLAAVAARRALRA